MSEIEKKESPRMCTVRLVGLQDGAAEEELVEALSRLDPRRPKEQIAELVKKLPVVLTRSATEEAAKKFHALLTPKGAVLKTTYNTAGAAPSPASASAPTSASAPSPVQKAVAARPVPAGKRVPTPVAQKAVPQAGEPSGAERRVKPRVHPGIRIHPMGVGEILDRSFRLLKERFWMFFLILFIPQFAYFVVNQVGTLLLGGAGVGQASMGMGFGISALVAFLIFIVLQFWAQGALIHAVSETYLGHLTSVGTAYGSVRKRLGRLLGTLILTGVLVFLWPALAGILAAIAVPVLAAMGIGGGLVVLLSVVVGILLLWLTVRLFLNWFLVDKVVVLEDVGGMSALRRSKELMNARTEEGYWKRPKNKAALIMVVGFVIAMGIHLLFQIPGMAFSALLPGLLSTALTGLLGIVSTSLATVYTAIAMILFYYDIRLRKEGFDLKLMAQGLG